MKSAALHAVYCFFLPRFAGTPKPDIAAAHCHCLANRPQGVETLSGAGESARKSAALITPRNDRKRRNKNKQRESVHGHADRTKTAFLKLRQRLKRPTNSSGSFANCAGWDGKRKPRDCRRSCDGGVQPTQTPCSRARVRPIDFGEGHKARFARQSPGPSRRAGPARFAAKHALIQHFNPAYG